MNHSVKRVNKRPLISSANQIFLDEKVSTSGLINDKEKDLVYLFTRMWMDLHKYETVRFKDFLSYVSGENIIPERLKKIPLFVQVMETMRKVFEKQEMLDAAGKFKNNIKS